MPKPHIRVVAAQIERDGKFLITQRKPSSSLPLLWEFPGGRVEEGESDEDALARELKEEMDVQTTIGTSLISMTHEYAAYIIDFNVYQATIQTQDDQIKCIGVHAFKWVDPSDLDQYEFPGADQASIDALLSED